MSDQVKHFPGNNTISPGDGQNNLKEQAGFSEGQPE